MSRELRKIANRFKSIIKRAQWAADMSQEPNMSMPQEPNMSMPQEPNMSTPEQQNMSGQNASMPYAGPAQKTQRVAGNPEILQLQKNLNILGYLGMNAGKLQEDGVMGKNTNYAINLYRQKNEARIAGAPQEKNLKLLAVMIDRDAKMKGKTRSEQSGLVTENPYRTV